MDKVKQTYLKVPFNCALLASTFLRIYPTYFLVEGIVCLSRTKR